jgi:hypothetical protein
MNILNLSLKVKHILCKGWNINKSFLCHAHLTLILCYLDADHSDVILNALNIHLGCSQNIFLDVGLFIKNAELIITINELYTSDITILTGLFILLA